MCSERRGVAMQRIQVSQRAAAAWMTGGMRMRRPGPPPSRRTTRRCGEVCQRCYSAMHVEAAQTTAVTVILDAGGHDSEMRV